MKLYRMNVDLVATLYVRAENADDAAAKAISYAGTRQDPSGDELFADYNPRTEDVVMSPAVTFYGRSDNCSEQLEAEELSDFAAYFGEDNGRCRLCGADLENPSASGAEDGVCGPCISGED